MYRGYRPGPPCRPRLRPSEEAKRRGEGAGWRFHAPPLPRITLSDCKSRSKRRLLCSSNSFETALSRPRVQSPDRPQQRRLKQALSPPPRFAFLWHPTQLSHRVCPPATAAAAVAEAAAAVAAEKLTRCRTWKCMTCSTSLNARMTLRPPPPQLCVSWSSSDCGFVFFVRSVCDAALGFVQVQAPCARIVLLEIFWCAADAQL